MVSTCVNDETRKKKKKKKKQEQMSFTGRWQADYSWLSIKPFLQENDKEKNISQKYEF